MRVKTVLFLFVISAVVLIFMALQNAKSLHKAHLEKVRLSKIQMFSMKDYKRTRKIYTPERSLVLAQMEIKNILEEGIIDLEENSISNQVKSRLVEIANILNHVKEDVVLSIEVHSKLSGSKYKNLKLSQEQADILKSYFIEKTTLPLIVAIGYGETSALKNGKTALNLKRIQ